MVTGTAQQLTERLALINRWYGGMVNADTGLFEYLYLPQSDAFVRGESPIRAIASVWDAELLADFLQEHTLAAVIETSLQHFRGWLTERDGYLILDPNRLGEPSAIAHSAFMMLALLHAPIGAGDPGRIAGLAEGILRQQRANGSYAVYFDGLPDQGEELYAGEAMLALLEAHRHCSEARYLESVERACSFYDASYFRRERVSADLLVFFANWQSQACALLFRDTTNPSVKKDVIAFTSAMHDRIIEEGFYESVARHPARQVCVEVACAVEGLNEAYALASFAGDPRAERYRRCLCIALDYLLGLQCTRDGTQRERGGFGMSVDERAQRIDVTGHAASAFMKSVRNAVDCPTTGPDWALR